MMVMMMMRLPITKMKMMETIMVAIVRMVRQLISRTVTHHRITTTAMTMMMMKMALRNHRRHQNQIRKVVAIMRTAAMRTSRTKRTAAKQQTTRIKAIKIRMKRPTMTTMKMIHHTKICRLRWKATMPLTTATMMDRRRSTMMSQLVDTT